MRTKLAPVALAAALALSACAADEDANAPTTTAAPTTETVAPTTETAAPTTEAQRAPTTTTSPDGDLPANTQVGVITIHLETVEGIFIEGFEAGIRLETPEGKVLYSTLWTDFVALQDNPTITDYYQSVLSRSVPAGELVILATVNIGQGPAPVTPNITGEMSCRLVLDVPADGVVDVELAFSGSKNCLSVTDVS